MEKHERYVITTSFTVCEGLQDKALEEVKELLHHIHDKSLDHASDLKVVVTHKPMDEAHG
jgi:hypothetical protein